MCSIRSSVECNAPRNVCGPQVRRLRSGRGWSQEHFALKCQLAGWDISRDVIASIELRRRCIEDDELAWLARVLAVKIEELYPPRIRARLP